MNERLPNGLTPEQDAAFDALARALADAYEVPNADARARLARALREPTKPLHPTTDPEGA